MTRSHRFKSVRDTHPDFANRFHESSLVKPEDVSKGSRSIAIYTCDFCGKLWSAPVRSAVNGSGLCFVCAHKKFSKKSESIAVTHPFVLAFWSELNEFPPSFYSSGSNKKVFWICNNCGEVFERIVQDFLRRENKHCLNCTNRRHRTSKAEVELLVFLNSVHDSFVQSERSVIYPYEIDCFSQALMVGFEFNGTYWHSDEMIKKTRGMSAREYHDLKTDLCENVGIKLFHIAEKDWKASQALVKDFILRILQPVL